MCDYLVVVKMYQAHVYVLYGDPKTAFVSYVFYDFKALLNGLHDTISSASTSSALDLNDFGEETLVFKCGPHTYPAMHVT